MLGVLSTNLPESVSTAVIGSVLECHDQGFHFLGGMVPVVDRAGIQVYVGSDASASVGLFAPSSNDKITRGRWFDLGVDYDSSPAEAELEPVTFAANAVRHLGALMVRDRDEKMRYLSDAGMGNAEIASLIALVIRWLGEAGLEKLGDLSRIAVESDLGPGHVLERWINGRSQLDLALLLDATPIGDWELAVAYAFAHASELVLASYWSDGVPDDGVLSLVPGDDLD